mmetsp:Transcript_24501/g.47637  ORF Transcript_24501/g.47637 Transcript_24501/m.47637 type:complete len:270 (-) Transcript_24501:152-961(-)
MPADSELPVILQPINYPATSAVIGFCCLVCFYLNRNGLGYADVGSSYRLVVKEGQWWRTITASFSHLSVMHLLFNTYSTWQMRQAEVSLGVLGYLRLTVLFLLLSILFQLGLHAMLAHSRWGERTQNTIGIGFSCVCFGWMTWASLHEAGAQLDLFLIRIPFSISPFVSLIVIQLMIPNVDFVGHLAGILAGYVEGWGLVGWLRGYWLIQACVWVCVATLVSWLRSGNTVPFLQEVGLSEAEQAGTASSDSLHPDPWLTPRSRLECSNA